jgi:5-methylcytosine-specific restriction endonuclease McrA
MTSETLSIFKRDLSVERLQLLFTGFLKDFLGSEDAYIGYILFTKQHRDKILELADSALKTSEYHNRIVDLSTAWEKGEASPMQMLDVYLFDECQTEEQKAAHYAKMKSLPYPDFLKSDYWEIVREVVLERYGEKCALCGNPHQLNVHHRDYSHRGMEHEHFDDLIVLCYACHGKFHDKLPVSGRSTR